MLSVAVIKNSFWCHPSIGLSRSFLWSNATWLQLLFLLLLHQQARICMHTRLNVTGPGWYAWDLYHSSDRGVMLFKKVFQEYLLLYFLTFLKLVLIRLQISKMFTASDIEKKEKYVNPDSKLRWAALLPRKCWRVEDVLNLKVEISCQQKSTPHVG